MMTNTNKATRYLVIEDRGAGEIWTVDALEGYSDQFYAAPHGTVIATVTSAQEAERIATEQRRLYYRYLVIEDLEGSVRIVEGLPGYTDSFYAGRDRVIASVPTLAEAKQVRP